MQDIGPTAVATDDTFQGMPTSYSHTSAVQWLFSLANSTPVISIQIDKAKGFSTSDIFESTLMFSQIIWDSNGLWCVYLLKAVQPELTSQSPLLHLPKFRSRAWVGYVPIELCQPAAKQR